MTFLKRYWAVFVVAPLFIAHNHHWLTGLELVVTLGYLGLFAMNFELQTEMRRLRDERRRDNEQLWRALNEVKLSQ